MKTGTSEFKGTFDRKPEGRRITSASQFDYLDKKNPSLAANMMNKTSPTEFLPGRATRRKKK